MIYIFWVNRILLDKNTLNKFNKGHMTYLI